MIIQHLLSYINLKKITTNMKSLSILFCFSLLLTSISAKIKAADQGQANDVYIVYMGGKSSSNGCAKDDDHSQLLSSLSRRNAVVHIYKHGFLGFAAHLSKDEAHSIARKPSVLSVFPDPVIQLQTTHSWDFLKYQTVRRNIASSVPTSHSTTKGSDTIIGILDTGIWPESESFSDKNIGSIPLWWKGTCMEGENFTSSNCNRKLIGARYYNPDFPTPTDLEGHGTHVASTAAGAPVYNASYYGLAKGTTKGGSPGSRIAMYAVCTAGCMGSAIMAAFDDAIADGVNILSLSLGLQSSPDFLEDSIALGAYHAVENGIMVVCAAGNQGPGSKTVVNDAPWIMTVAATTIDRDFRSNVVLGGNKLIKGGGINFSLLQKSPIYPLKYGNIAKGTSNSTYAGRNCIPDELDESKVKGNIILCSNDDNKYFSLDKANKIKELGGLGAIFIDDDMRIVPFNTLDFPVTSVISKDGLVIISYISSIRNPTATILATRVLLNYEPAPIIPKFSSRGPSSIIENLLKPDIAAPGVAILAAWLENDSEIKLPGRESPVFNVISGTSMACPHVSGIAAFVRSQNPTWSPSAIKSAIITTAIRTNNLGAPITTTLGSVATPYDYGAGEVSTIETLHPGLVYETGATDYLEFLCNYGYNLSTIKLIASKIPDGFSCPHNSTVDFISDMNYPSISISGLSGSKKVSRTVTNVGEEETVYVATLDVPAEMDVKVVPEKLHFSKKNKKLSYEVIFTSLASSPTKDTFGSITWSNGKNKVRSTIVVSKK